ncbi:hypothetical protein PG996_011135 [Apiospora saccharicola]|uniref:Uncharacterized protein n=1 Tax=Apiospora saccharicola TaxID=335842 RepID=A0ABR1UGZ2_9PEZI
MGDYYPDYDTSKDWWPGDPLPKGGPIKLDRSKQPIKAIYETGHGTRGSPKVYWQSSADIKGLKEAGGKDPYKYINATETFVVEEAQKLNLGITHIWIRRCWHDVSCTINKSTGLRIPGDTESCDPHITVYFGQAPHHANFDGHLYVAKPLATRDDEDTPPAWSVLPYRPMAPGDRTPPESLAISRTWVARNPDLWKHDPHGTIAQEVSHQSRLAKPSWRR